MKFGFDLAMRFKRRRALKRMVLNDVYSPGAGADNLVLCCKFSPLND